MIGVRLFLHALRMVLSSPGPALRIVGVLAVVQAVAGMVLGQAAPGPGGDMPGMVSMGANAAVGGLILLAVNLLASAWIAVAWHRYVLRDEVPTGLLPPFRGDAFGAYLVAGVVFVAVIVAVAVPVVMVVALATFPFLDAEGPGLLPALTLGLLTYVPIAYVGYRISPILPSAALGARMPLREAWYATGTSGAALVVLALVSVLAALVANLPVLILGQVLGALWAFAVQAVSVLVSASVATTIYGHYVEGRALHA